ncbi:hypothetical protein AADZ86_04795 [Colwelliaceae bacterium BS250]
MKTLNKYALSILTASILSCTAQAEDVQNKPQTQASETVINQQSNNVALTEEELAEIQQKLNNPLADLWLLFLQNDYTSFQDAQNNDYQINSLKFQPVMSFDFSENYNLIVRPTIQHLSIEAPGLDRESGLGDVGLLAAFGPKTDMGGWVIGGGFTSMFPTAKEDALTTLGANQAAVGPAIVALKIGEKNTYGAVVQHFQGVGSSDLRDINGNEEDISLTDIQYVFRTKISPTVQVGFAPNIQIDWTKEGSDRFSIPIGLGIDKITRIGNMPIRVGIEAYHYVEQNDQFGPDWGIRFFAIPVIQPLF